MKMHIISLIIGLTVQYSGGNSDDCNQYSRRGIEIDTLPIEELSDGWNTLRNLDNHCIRAWGSDLQKIMIRSGKILGQPHTDRSEIVRWMGVPDYEAEKVEVLKLEENEKILIYFWRGWHDWLYFILDENEKVKLSDWWYAFE